MLGLAVWTLDPVSTFQVLELQACVTTEICDCFLCEVCLLV